jgi:hypothetical protein
MLDVQGRTFNEIAPELVYVRNDTLIAVSLRVTAEPSKCEAE